MISPGITRKPVAAVARFQMTPRSAPFGISEQKSGQARAPARQAPTLEERDATYKASWPSKAGLTAKCFPGTETTPAQEAGLTAECSRGTETTPAQETSMTVQDVEGKGTSGIGK